jgi:YaiO family outer membrane protein
MRATEGAGPEAGAAAPRGAQPGGLTIHAAACRESRRAASLLAGALLSLGAAGLAAAQAPGDSLTSLRHQGEQLRREQRLPEALGVYQALVLRDPTSFEDRFWVAKLESWTGRLPAADSMLTRLLNERPGEYDSRLALADVRMWRGQYPAALALLDSLNQAHPGDSEVLFRLGRVQEARGRPREARIWFARALAADPANTDAKAALSRLAGVGRWQTGLEYFGEQISNAPATNGTTASVEALPGGRVRWRLAATVQDKFGRTETRFGGELGHPLAGGTRLEWAAYVAPGADVLPRQTYGVSVAQKAGGRLVLYADYAFLDFSDARVHQVGPRFELYAGRRWLVTGRYSYSSTRFTGVPDAVANHSGSASLGYLYGRDNRVQVFAGAGAESFAGPSRDVIGGFHAHTVAVAWRQSLLPRLGLALLYAHQARSDGTRQDSYGLGLVQRW